MDKGDVSRNGESYQTAGISLHKDATIFRVPVRLIYLL
jgi:hypothetical protein